VCFISRSRRQPSGSSSILFFFFTDTSTTEIYTLSLHDALPICFAGPRAAGRAPAAARADRSLHSARRSLAHPLRRRPRPRAEIRSEEHTSELQSRGHLVCRLLLEKKKIKLTFSCPTSTHAYTYA